MSNVYWGFVAACLVTATASAVYFLIRGREYEFCCAMVLMVIGSYGALMVAA